MEINQKYMCRVPLPDCALRSLVGMNRTIDATMNGLNVFYSEGNLRDWDRWDDLNRITTPTLLIVGKYDMMDVEDVRKMSQLIPNAQLVVCNDSAHLSMIDEPETYFQAIKVFCEQLSN
jgi:proline iminopeptidase